MTADKFTCEICIKCAVLKHALLQCIPVFVLLWCGSCITKTHLDSHSEFSIWCMHVSQHLVCKSKRHSVLSMRRVH